MSQAVSVALSGIGGFLVGLVLMLAYRHRWRERTLQRRCPEDVLDGLRFLNAEFPDCAGFIADAILYATLGRDRRRLTMEFVGQARKNCEMMRWVKDPNDA